MENRIPREMLERSAAEHKHFCPRQALGLRMGLLGGRLLRFELPRNDKRLLTILETDGCAADGVSAATGCTVGHRTLRVMDFGKVAATFINVKSGEAFRIFPRLDVRQTASQYMPEARSRWHAQLEAYQIMPDEDLLSVQKVVLSRSLEEILSKPGYRVNCQSCGEEIINEREVEAEETTLCQACAGDGYYQIVEVDMVVRNLD